MKLHELLGSLTEFEVKGSTDVDVAGITYNSQEVKPGWMFVAISGHKKDGRNFIPQAVDKGASTLVFEGEFFDKLRATQIRVRGARASLALLSSAFFVHPTQAFYLVGVTGTNGKTTLTYLMEALWQGAGIKAGLVGTISCRFGGRELPAACTTPESRDLQEIFSRMRDRSVERVCMEVSSHGLELSRVEGCRFDACVFTNLTRDHLDFHGSMDAYYRSKEKLFIHHLRESGKKNRLALICRNDPYGKKLIQKLKKESFPFFSYGIVSGTNDYFAKKFSYSIQGIRATMETPHGSLSIESPLVGRFNLLNLLAGAAVGFHSGLSKTQIEEGISRFQGAPGRLERIEDREGRKIFVDYAHTPDALKNVLQTLRDLKPRRIIAVFGCGGDRDKGKRAEMGYQAASLSDVCLVTSDNPRTENPDVIINQIMTGVRRSSLGPFRQKKGYLTEVDRKKAIQKALEISGSGDAVLVAGKGHEDYQIVGSTKFPFSDQKIIRKFLKK